MKNYNFKNSFFNLFLVSLNMFNLACSNLLEWDQEKDQAYRILPIEQTKPPLDCFQQSDQSWVITEHSQVTEVMVEYNRRFSPKVHELFVATALLHLNARPDMVSSNSRIDIFHFQGSQTPVHQSNSFFNTSTARPHFPYFSFLEKFAKANSAYPLSKIIERLDSIPVKNWKVDQEIAQNLSTISIENTNESFKTAYLKSGDLLQVGESLPTFKISEIYRRYSSLKKNGSESYNVSISHPSCNLKAQTDINSAFPAKKLPYVLFLVGNKNEVLLGMTGQNLETILNSDKKLSMIEGLPLELSPEYCYQRDEFGNNLFALVYNGLAADQLLHHLFLEENLNNKIDIDPVLLETTLNRPRWIIRTSPIRIIGEFSRADRMFSQLRDIPTSLQSWPMYDGSLIGKAMLLSNFNKGNLPYQIHLDPRSSINSACLYPRK